MSDLSIFDLTGKTALVTGGARGIGRAAATALARAGADVAIVDLNEELATETATTIQELGSNTLAVKCDVTQADQVDSVITTILDEFGRLDIAINNAGIYVPGRDENHSQDDWNSVIAVNLTGVWLCAQAEMRAMSRQNSLEGKIINIASVAAGLVSSNASYDASKAGVVQLTRTLAAQWGSYNINVNCISPGYVVAAWGTTRAPLERERIRAITPLGHVLRLEDLYGAVIFLASAASDYITGQNIVVDGGATLHPVELAVNDGASLERRTPPRVDPESEVVETG